MLKNTLEKLPLILFACSITAVVFAYGVLVGHLKIFPYTLLSSAKDGLTALKFSDERAIAQELFIPTDRPDREPIRRIEEASPGLNWISRFGEEQSIVFEIETLEGQLLHQWDIDWYELWPDWSHLDPHFAPVGNPGAMTNGMVVLENGDLVFSFSFKGLIRIDPEGNVVWRLPYQTHHSVVYDGEVLWVSGQKQGTPDGSSSEYRESIYDEYTLLAVSVGGEIVKEWSIADLLKRDGRLGLYPLGQPIDFTASRDDRMHANDLEPFPIEMEPGFFDHDDLMVSLRNVNTVIVFDHETEETKYISTGLFDLQHDPDFVDGNHYSVYDNGRAVERSRVLIIDARTDDVEIAYEGNEETPFYSEFMGRSQWLDNGNLLITESFQGRAFEVNPEGEIVWECINKIEPGIVGLLMELQRIPEEMAEFYGNQL